MARAKENTDIELEREAADDVDASSAPMTAIAAEPAPEVSQAEPTAAQPRDANGHVLDEYGLPLSGPLRAARLVELNADDPRDVDVFNVPRAEPWRSMKLSALGRRDPETHPEDWS